MANAVLKAIDNAKTRGKKPEDVEKIVSDALNERELDFQSSKYDATRKVGGEKASGRDVMLSRPRVAGRDLAFHPAHCVLQHRGAEALVPHTGPSAAQL